MGQTEGAPADDRPRTLADLIGAQTTIRAWITKYALGCGIVEVEAEERRQAGPDRIKVRSQHGYYDYYGPDEWHRDRESAVKRAEKMRANEIRKLMEEIERLRGLRFEGKEGE